MQQREKEIRSIFQDKDIPAHTADELAAILAAYTKPLKLDHKKERYNKTFSLKVTKATEPILEYIIQYSLKNASLSSYLRQILESYCNLSQV